MRIASCKWLLVLCTALTAPAFAAKHPKPATPPPPPVVAAPAAPERVTSVEGITEYRLANGLRVLLFPDQTKQTLTVNMTYLVGSRHENYGETGMAHLLEHMLFKGTPRHKDVPSELASHGARPNGTTSVDRTNYYETFNATEDNLRWALDFEADRMTNANIAKQDLDTEMTVVRNEFERNENDPSNVLFERMMSAAYDWHNYGKDTIGARSDIEGVPIDRLQAFYRTYYQPDNAMLVVAGKFDEAKTLAVIQEIFGAIPRPTRVLQRLYTVEPTQDGERQVSLRRVGDVQLAAVCYHVPAGAHADFAALQILTEIMSDAPAGRLHKDLVETSKAAGVFGEALQLAEPGLIGFGAQVRADQSLDAALALLIASVEKTSVKPITDAEVERARAQLLKQIELNLNNSGAIGLELSNWAAMGDWRLMFLHRDRLRAVKTADVQRVWASYFKPANRTVGLFYPTKQPDRAVIPAPPDVAALVKDYKGDTAKEAGEAFDPSPANIDARTQRTTLPSGLKLALLPKKTRGSTVVAVLTLHLGDAQNLMNRGDAGSMTGAMLMRGSKHHTRQQIQDELDRLKARAQVTGGNESAAVSVETTRENLPAVLTLLTEVIREPVFDPKELEQLRAERLAAMEEQRSEPTNVGFIAFQKHVAPYPKGHPRYVATVDESIADIKAVTREQVAKFHADFYGAQTAELSVVGDFDAAELTKQATTLLGDWKAAKRFARIPYEYKDIVPQPQVIETPDKANAMFIAGTTIALSDRDADYPAVALGNFIFGGGFLKSRLFSRIRIAEGLSYSVGSQLLARPLDKAGGFFSFAIYAPQNADKVEKTFNEELTRILTTDIPADELAQAKSGWMQSRSVSRSQDAELVRNLNGQTFLDRTMAWDADLEKRVMALDAGQIRAALNRYLLPAKFTVVKAGDFAGAAAKKPAN
jgi:zinc protease